MGNKAAIGRHQGDRSLALPDDNTGQGDPSGIRDRFVQHGIEISTSVAIRRDITAGVEVLVSPGFCRNLGSGGEPECLHFIGVLSFDDKFREAVAWGSIQEKFRHALA
jgi:hypothetical protein